MSSFSLQIRAFIEKTKQDLDTVTRTVVLKVSDELVDRSPTGDRERWAVNIDRKARGLPPTPVGYVGGRFKNNWMIGIDSPNTSTLAGVDPFGTGAHARAMAAIPNNAAGKVIFITNSLPYAKRLENGWSSIAPSGMVALTVVRWQGIMAEAVAEVKAGT